MNNQNLYEKSMKQSSVDNQTKFRFDEHGSFNFFHFLFYFHSSLWIVIFGLELQTRKLKGIGSGTQITQLSVIQTGWKNSQTTGKDKNIALK